MTVGDDELPGEGGGGGRVGVGRYGSIICTMMLQARDWYWPFCCHCPVIAWFLFRRFIYSFFFY